jgi:hypothetical protein
MENDLQPPASGVDPWSLDVVAQATADRNRIAARPLFTPFGGMDLASLLDDGATGMHHARGGTSVQASGATRIVPLSGAVVVEGTRPVEAAGPERETAHTHRCASRRDFGTLGGYLLREVIDVRRQGFSVQVGPYVLSVMASWRVVTGTGDLLLGSTEWRRMFRGSPATNATLLARRLLLDRRVVHASAVGETADLVVHLSGGQRLETWSDRADAVTWQLTGPGAAPVQIR